MRESMGRLTPRFSADRTVREYTERYYIPAASAYLERAAQKGAMGGKIANWQHTIEENWPKIRFGEEKITSDERTHTFEIQVYLGDLDADSVRVELYAEGINGGEPVQQEMARSWQLVGANGYIYRAELPATRPATDYSARITPRFSGVRVPLELPRILWQR